MGPRLRGTDKNLNSILYSQNFFKTVAPANFTTFATPHIGLVADGTMWSKMVKFFGSRLLSRTGEQFHAMDKWSPDGEPLLLAMSVKGMRSSDATSAY